MNVITKKIQVKTKANGGMHDITAQIEKSLSLTHLKEGNVTIFCIGSTCSLSTVEFEPGLCEDLPACLDRIAPSTINYAHHERWHDDNGPSHVKATLMGPSLVIPFVEVSLTLGTWQQIVLFEWDTRPRSREIILQFMGI